MPLGVLPKLPLGAGGVGFPPISRYMLGVADTPEKLRNFVDLQPITEANIYQTWLGDYRDSGSSLLLTTSTSQTTSSELLFLGSYFGVDKDLYFTVFALKDLNTNWAADVNSYIGETYRVAQAAEILQIRINAPPTTPTVAFKPGIPVLKEAIPIAGGKVQVKFTYRPGSVASGGDPDSFSIRVDGVHDTAVSFETGKADYKADTTALSETPAQAITVVALSGSIESVSNVIFVTPDATAPSPIQDCTEVIIQQLEI